MLSTNDQPVRAKLRLPSTADFRRRGPRPLALHVAQAEWAWRNGNPGQLASFYRGVEAYRRHPYRRAKPARPTVSKYGGSSLRDYGPEDGWPLLAVPSLVNRPYILDLMPGVSFLDYLSDNGMRPFLLDWGDAPQADRKLSLDSLILERIGPALDWLRRTTGKRPLILGYCMGGTLATALACLRQSDLAGLALLATPWKFDHGQNGIDKAQPLYSAFAAGAGLIGSAPIDVLQTMFAQIDPLNVPMKFARFAGTSPTSDAAIRFVAIEDWLNDGVPLGAEIFAECLLDWYGSNMPARAAWRVNGEPVRPERLKLPTCLAIPENDRIVPPQSALALANLLSDCQLIRPGGGHVGMIAGQNAEGVLWAPILDWLKRIAAMQKNPW